MISNKNILSNTIKKWNYILKIISSNFKLNLIFFEVSN